MEVYRRDHAVVRTWPAAETIMVCVNMKSRAPRLIRAARQMAADLHAKWIAVYVQIPSHLRLPQTERDRFVQTLRLAEQLGAETVTLTGEDVAQEILSYARSRNATKIIVGKPLRPRWKEWLFGSVVSDLVHQSGEIDIYVITGAAGEGQPLVRRTLQSTSDTLGYVYALAGVSTATAVDWLMFPHFAAANLVMTYLIAVIVIAIRWGQGPSVLASILSVASFDFFFVPPYFTFAVSDAQYLLTFGVMLVAALVISNLAVRIRQQAELARYRERRTSVLYSMSRDLPLIEEQRSWLNWQPNIFGTCLTLRWPFSSRTPRSESNCNEENFCFLNWSLRRLVWLNGCTTTMREPGSEPIRFQEPVLCICRWRARPDRSESSRSDLRMPHSCWTLNSCICWSLW
jgi:two-component system sensor histidine kinase KdpD